MFVHLSDDNLSTINSIFIKSYKRVVYFNTIAEFEYEKNQSRDCRDIGVARLAEKY